MFSFYKNNGSGLEELDKHQNGCWINAYPPFNHDNLEKLSGELDIPLDYLIDSLDVDERSRFEEEDGVKLIVINCSIPNDVEPENDATYVTIPIGIIITESLVLTISPFENPIISSLLKSKSPKLDPSNKESFILHIFERIVHFYLLHLQDVNNKRLIFEKELSKSLRNEELTKLMNIQKSLVYFETALRINELMMLKMQRTDFLKVKNSEEESDLFEDILIDSSQALEMASVYSNILNGTMGAYSSIISNNLNFVMKRLTSVTIVLMVPTLVASFYGMNVKLPGEGSDMAFGGTLLISLLLAVSLVWFFMRKKWF